MPEMDKFIEIANHAANEAGALIRRYFHTKVSASHKEAASPIVTEADLEAEKLIRRILRNAFPEHAIYGEEEGYDPGNSSYEWILDPIDGTIAFSCGKPLFASLISLCKDGQPILGIIDQPVIGHRWVGASDRQTTFNGSPCKTSDLVDLSRARFSTTAPEMFDGGQENTLSALKNACWVTSYGGDAYAYGLLSSGHIDVIAERGLSRHDISALIPVILGAGGDVSDLDGTPIQAIEEHTSGRKYTACAFANAKIREQVLALIH